MYAMTPVDFHLNTVVVANLLVPTMNGDQLGYSDTEHLLKSL